MFSEQATYHVICDTPECKARIELSLDEIVLSGDIRIAAEHHGWQVSDKVTHNGHVNWKTYCPQHKAE